MADIGERAEDLKSGDLIVCNDGDYWLRVIEIRRLVPNVVDVVTHLRQSPGGPHHVMHYSPDDRVEIVRF
jgi:hypothetical protein